MNRCFTDLARLKTQKDKLEERIKTAEAKCIADHGTPDNVETKYGTLVFNSRPNWEVHDQVKVREQVGQELFNEYANMTFSSIKKVGGDVIVKTLEAVGAVEFTGDSKYYSLRKPKK